MPTEKLPVYTEDKTQCDNCNHAFKPGEVISVDKRQKLTFCYSDSDGGCAMPYVFKRGIAVCGIPMIFADNSANPGNRTPNYPNMPLAQVNGRKKKWWHIF